VRSGVSAVRDGRRSSLLTWVGMGKQLNEGHMGYAIEMRTRPQTIGVAFNDHPVGIMM
jgi:hypothetical protein